MMYLSLALNVTFLSCQRSTGDTYKAPHSNASLRPKFPVRIDVNCHRYFDYACSCMGTAAASRVASAMMNTLDYAIILMLL